MKKLFFILILLIVVCILLYKYLGGFPIGFHNGRLVIYHRFYSVMCPECGSGWDIKYYKVNSEEECQRIKGRPLIDLEFGGFYGCAPINFW